MGHFLTTLILLLALPMTAMGQTTDHCPRLRALIADTYNFKPSQLPESGRDAATTAVNKVWTLARAYPVALAPCLRAALEDPSADQWFRFDGSNLLVELDPSRESKVFQVQQYSNVDLNDVKLQTWVETIARRGTEGFDVSEAGDKWLKHPSAQYTIPHGQAVSTFDGALMIYGSMDEVLATPALARIAADVGHPGRDHALLLLMRQATPEALEASKTIDSSTFSKATHTSVTALAKSLELIAPRAQPRLSRNQLLDEFYAILNGNFRIFTQFVSKVPDWKTDAVAVLAPGEIPLIRKVRRVVIATGPHPFAAAFYDDFTAVMMTLMLKESRE